MEKSDINKDIEYFAKNYSLVEPFFGIWLKYTFLKSESVNEEQEKSFQYYIYCYQQACYRKWDTRFPNFLFLKECFRKQLKLYCLPGFCVAKLSWLTMLIFCAILKILLVVL